MTTAREDLLGRIVAHYAEHGVRDSSLRTLAAAIGTSQRMLHYHFGSREDVLAAVIDAVAEGQAQHIAAVFGDEPDAKVAGERNWRATVEGAQLYGALWFELATHAMRQAPYAARLGEVIAQAPLRQYARLYAEHTTPAHALRLARLTVAVGQGLILGLLVDGDRRAADEAIIAFGRMIHHELTDRQPREHR